MITVVIPLYNKEPHIAKTLESVLAQTCPPSDIVVVDDGSKDQGAAVVARYADRGVRLIQQANQGESAARNTGIAAANTPYIAFLDADDWWLPEHLDELTRLIQAHPQAALLSTSHFICREGEMYRAKTDLPEGWRGQIPDFFAQYAQGLSLINSSTSCVQKSALLEVGCFPLEGNRRGKDIVTWIKLALLYPCFHVNVPTSVYNQEAVNRSNLIKEEDPPASLQFMSEILLGSNALGPFKPSLNRLFDRIAFFTAAGFILDGDKKGAAKIAKLARVTRRFKSFLAIAALLTLPIVVLRVAKRYRHKKIL